jgi:hypothetical protein
MQQYAAWAEHLRSVRKRRVYRRISFPEVSKKVMCQVDPHKLNAWVHPNDASARSIRPKASISHGVAHFRIFASVNGIT